jgi:D-alanyl-D-alanine carboxypeptidase
MNPRLAALAPLCREVVLPALVLVWIVAFGPAAIDRTGAAPIVERHANSSANSLHADAQPAIVKSADAKLANADVKLANADVKLNADTKPADKLPIALSAADASPITRSVTVASAGDATPVSREPDPVVTAALTDPSATTETTPPEAAPDPAAKMAMATPEPVDTNPAAAAAGTGEVPGDCAATDSCVDHYLWTLYQRTPKEDSVKEQQQKQVSVKRKGKMVTVTRTVTTLADEDFGWKDPKAADHVGMPVTDYVIGGMDREFKQRLFHLLRAAEQAGLVPGITSAFRDDYRQSIASGLKAANERSYHGGSLRGGYGHGIAADIVSINGETRQQRLNASQTLWAWVDKHGKEFGMGRPYLNRDPPHVAPIDGEEYAKHRPGAKSRQAGSAAKPSNSAAKPDDHAAAKRARTARSSRVGTT